MDFKIVDKRKALIINEEDKILVIQDEMGFGYPSINKENGRILNILGENYLENYKLLLSTKNEGTKCRTENGHLIKTRLLRRYHYYAMYHQLTPEEKIAFIRLCERKEGQPNFLSLEEIRYFYESMYYTKSYWDIPLQKMEPIFFLENKKGIDKKLRKENLYVRN
jgi:hypothetical protein